MGDLPRERLEACVRRHVPSADAVRLERIRTGKFNTSYFVEADGRSCVLRVAPPQDAVFLFYERRMMHQEPDLHRLLRAETDVPVAEIVAFDTSRADLDRDYLLMERLPGRALSDAPGTDTARTLRQTGAALAQAHALTADRYGYLGAHRPMEPRATWVEAFRVMWDKLLADVVGVGFYTEGQAAALAALLERHLDRFDYDQPARLLHMDVWAQNLLVDGRGNLTGLVDWDRALWGDPEIEFAVLDYCGVSEPPFWAGYGRERDPSPAAQVRRHFYLLYELQKYIVIRAGRGGDPAAAEGYARQALGYVERAFGEDVA